MSIISIVSSQYEETPPFPLVLREADNHAARARETEEQPRRGSERGAAERAETESSTSTRDRGATRESSTHTRDRGANGIPLRAVRHARRAPRERAAHHMRAPRAEHGGLMPPAEAARHAHQDSNRESRTAARYSAAVERTAREQCAEVSPPRGAASEAQPSERGKGSTSTRDRGAAQARHARHERQRNDGLGASRQLFVKRQFCEEPQRTQERVSHNAAAVLLEDFAKCARRLTKGTRAQHLNPLP